MQTQKTQWRPTILKAIHSLGLSFFCLLIISVIFTSNANATTDVSISNAQDTLKYLSPDDYGKWENIGYGGSISNNGNWLIYPVRRNNDNHELRLHNLLTSKTKILKNGSAQKISNNSQWLGYLIDPPAKERKKLEKQKKPIYKNFGLLDIISSDSIEIPNVSSFSFSDDSKYVVLKQYAPKGSKKKGVDIIVRNLITGQHFSFGNVVEYSWQDEGSLLAFVVETKGKSGNGIQLFDGKNETTRLLDSEEAIYSGLSWRKKSNDLAVYRATINEEYDDSTNVILAWKNLSQSTFKSFTFDQSEYPVFQDDKRVVNNKSLKWSKDGNSVFFETIKWHKKPAKPDTTNIQKDSVENVLEKKINNHLFEEAPGLQIWHSKDVRIIPEQQQLANRKREFSHLAVWHLNDNRFVQLGDELIEKTRFQDDSPFVLGLDATPYEFDGMFGRFNNDIYTIDIHSGNKEKILEEVNHLYSISPNGQTIIYLKNDHYHIYDIKSGKSFNATKGIPASFVNKDDDHPVAQKPPYGFVGWNESGSSFLIHSKYDVWQIDINGDKNVNISKSASDQIISRYVKVDSEQEYIDLDGPMYLRRTGEWSKKSGYSVVMPGKTPSEICWDDTYTSRFLKAKENSSFVYVSESYTDSPDYFHGSDVNSESIQVSETNPFQKDYHWGKAELINYNNEKGRKLQGSLFYPDNYDPDKKYPMITYIYELRSPYIHRYEVPSQRDYYNHKVFTSQGYFVLQPDIVFDEGDPGVSSVRIMEIAVKTVVDKGLIDPEKVGLVGHSWGGYQSAFAVTGTDIFAAAVAGAGLTNLVSMYGMVAWAFGGTPESYHFEVSQERMMVPPYKDVDGYVRNSPVFNVDKMNTPLLFEVGDNDKNVDWRQGIEMYNAARRAGKQMVMLVYANEGHGLRQDKNRYDYQQRILKWFAHYLKGEPAEDWILKGVPYTEQQKQLKNWKK